MNQKIKIYTIIVSVFLLGIVSQQQCLGSEKSASGAEMKSGMDMKMDMKKSEMTEQKSEQQDMMAAMMENWQQYATPGEGHDVLKSLVGQWEYSVLWRMSPQGEEQKSKGSSQIRWIMGGRFIQQEAVGEPEESMSQPFEGLGIIGFDNIKHQYNGIWIDNMGTGMMTSVGSFDPSSKSLNEVGDFSCPLTNSNRKYRAVTTFISSDEYTYETYMTDENGEEFRSMLISYNRKTG